MLQLLNDAIESESLRCLGKSSSAREEDVTPDKVATRIKVDGGSLVIAGGGVGDGWSREQAEHGPGSHPDVVPRGSVVAGARMDATSRLIRDEAADSRPNVEIHKLPVAIEQSGRQIHQVQQGSPTGPFDDRVEDP